MAEQRKALALGRSYRHFPVELKDGTGNPPRLAGRRVARLKPEYETDAID
jgi:hypothetical protein